MSATRVVSTNPRKSTRVRQVRKVFVINPNNPNKRPEHDNSAYKTYRQCEFCKISGPLVYFPKVFGSNGKEYGTVCKKCLSKETAKNIVFDAINKSDKSDAEKNQMRSRAMECIYVKGLNVTETKAALGLKPVAGGLESTAKVMSSLIKPVAKK
jgi:hypothetical protein